MSYQMVFWFRFGALLNTPENSVSNFSLQDSKKYWEVDKTKVSQKLIFCGNVNIEFIQERFLFMHKTWHSIHNERRVSVY